MDFFEMKRKKLQSYCKKHGIPANLKNVEMAERLSLIYKGEKNENPAPPRLRAGKGGLNVEVIDLDSDSGADDVEALDTVAGNDWKTNLSDELKLDEEADQFLTTTPESEVKSDHKVDSDTIAGNESNEKTNLSDEHKLDEETDQFLTTPESEVKSDHKVDSDTVAGNESIDKTNLSDEHKLDEETDQFLTTYPESEVKSDHKVDSDAFEVESASLQKTSQGREGSNMNLAPEVDDDIGSSYEEETMQMSINTGNIEDNHHASRGEDDKMMEREVEIDRASVKADVLEDTSGTEIVEDEPEILDPINIHKEPITENVNPLQVSPNESNVCLIEPVQKLDDNDCVMDETAAMCLDASTGSSVGNADACEVKSASSQKTSRGREESNMKLAPEGDDTGSSYEEETMQMSVNMGKIEDNQELHASPSVDGNMESEVEIKTTSGTADVLEDTSGTEKVEDEPETVEDEPESIMENVSPKDSGCLVEPVQKIDDNDCVVDETAAMCLDASKVAKNTDENSNAMAEDIVDEVHSSSFVVSDGTPVHVLHNDPSNEVETSDLDVHEMVATGSSVGNADACELKSASSHKTSRGREVSNMNLAPEGDDIGSSYVKETMQMSINMRKIEDNQELHHALPSDDENMMEKEIQFMTMSGKTDVLEDTSGTKIVEDENEKLDQINIHQESIMENVNSLHVSPKQSIGCLVEPVQKLDDHDCDMDETAAMCLDAKNTDENSNAIIEDIPDEVHSSSFEDSDETPVQVQPTDPSNEVDASDLDVYEMDATGTAAKTADTSAVKFDSSQKLNITPASDKMIGTSTELKNNSVSPRDIGVCDMEENMQIGEIEDQVDQSQEKLIDLSPNRLNNPKTPTNADIGICDLEADLQIGSNKENIDLSEKPSAVDTNHDEDLTDVVSEELHNDLTEGEDANMDDKIDLQDVCETGDSSEEAVNHLNVHNLVVTGTASENAATSVVKVVSEELANNLMEEEVEDVGDKFDLPEDVPETGNGSDILFNLDILGTASENAATSVVKVVSEELANNLMEEEVEDVGDKFDLPEDVPETGNGSDILFNLDILGTASENAATSVVKVVSEELANNLMEEEVEDVGDKFDLPEDVPETGNGSDILFNLDILGTASENAATSVVKVVSEELANNLMEEEVEDVGDKFDLPEDVPETGNGSDILFNLDILGTASENAATSVVKVVSEELANNLMEEEVEDVGDKFDLPEDVPETGNGSDILFNLDILGTASENAATSVVKVVSEELANNLMEEEVEDVGDKFDLPEDVPETGNGSDEPINQGSIDTPHGSNSNNADLLHVSLVESSSPLVGGQVQKSDDNDMPGGDYDLGNCGFAVDVFCSNDNSIAAEDTDEKTVVSMENHTYEGHSLSGKCLDDEDLQLAASVEFGKKLVEVEFDLLEDVCVTAKSKDETLKSCSINSPQGSTVNGFLGEFSSYFDGEIQKSDELISSIYPMATLDACEEEILGSSEKTCMAADPEECFGFSPNDLEASATKGFADGTCFNPTTLGDVVMETCNNMNESMQIDMMEKENSQGEGRNFFENSDVNDDIGGVEAEDGDQSTEMASRKRKRSDAISAELEKEEVKEDELVPTVPQTSEMDSSNFSLQQPFASDTASGDDDDPYQKRLDSPSKATPMIHKENIKFDKKEEVRSTMSRNKFAKRQPLQDLK